jgi:Asp-tRNA(Asn)/Glu-tRNA(Gln) amidotransferase A subunit family amidase
MSVPIGRDEGLPLGGQLMAPHLDEATMIAVAAALEGVVDATAEVR